MTPPWHNPHHPTSATTKKSPESIAPRIGNTIPTHKQRFLSHASPKLASMNPRLIAIDLDGTLLNSDGKVSPRNLAALRLAESAGAEIVIATGRRHCYAMRVLRDLNLRANSALVSSNGTVIRTLDSQLLHRAQMSLDTARWLCTHLDGFRNTLVLTFDRVGPDGEDSRGALVCEHLHDLHSSIGRWMASNEPYIAQVDRLEDALRADPPIQMMLCGTVARMAEAETRLLQHPAVTAVGDPFRPTAEITLHRTSYPDRDLSIVDILPSGSSKASALEFLAHKRSIALSDILAIGDNWNDVPMLRLAGHAVLMSNAPADLRTLAHQNGWTLAPPNDEDGVATVIESDFAEALA
jgi:hydroxymethylpyrimidine pyrophosphatase-like HAD family hydrolase